MVDLITMPKISENFRNIWKIKCNSTCNRKMPCLKLEKASNILFRNILTLELHIISFTADKYSRHFSNLRKDWQKSNTKLQPQFSHPIVVILGWNWGCGCGWLFAPHMLIGLGMSKPPNPTPTLIGWVVYFFSWFIRPQVGV